MSEPTFEFRAIGDEDVQSIVCLLSLGMCRALRDGTVSPAYACHRLFGPAVITRLRDAGAPTALLDALNLASELDAVARLVPHEFEEALRDLESRLVDSMRKLNLVEVRGEKWLQPTVS